MSFVNRWIEMFVKGTEIAEKLQLNLRSSERPFWMCIYIYIMTKKKKTAIVVHKKTKSLFMEANGSKQSIDWLKVSCRVHKLTKRLPLRLHIATSKLFSHVSVHGYRYRIRLSALKVHAPYPFSVQSFFCFVFLCTGYLLFYVIIITIIIVH